MGLAEAYEYCLAHHHLPTVSLTSAVCGGIGDLAAQLQRSRTSSTQRVGGNSSSNSSIDWNHNRIFWLKGSIGGLIWSQWYAFLDPITTAAAAAAGGGGGANDTAAPWIAAVLSTAAEQFLFCPLIFAVYDLPLPMLLRGDPVNRIPAQIRTQLMPVLWENAKVWTLANLVVYSAPLQWRVLISAAAEAVWQMLLAQQLAGSAGAGEQQQPVVATKQQQPQPAVDVYLPLANAMAAMEQQEATAMTQRASSVNRRLMDPVAVKQR